VFLGCCLLKSSPIFNGISPSLFRFPIPRLVGVLPEVSIKVSRYTIDYIVGILRIYSSSTILYIVTFGYGMAVGSPGNRWIQDDSNLDDLKGIMKQSVSKIKPFRRYAS
jgi:hypothetical protein